MTIEEFGKLVKEISVLCKRVDDVEYGRIEEDQQYIDSLLRIKQIGAICNADNGVDSMQEMVVIASGFYVNCGNTLNIHWNGIGDWQR